MAMEKIENDFTNAKYKQGTWVTFEHDGRTIRGLIKYYHKGDYFVNVFLRNGGETFYQIKEEDIMEEQAPYGKTTAIGEGKPKYKVGDLVRYYEMHGTTRVDKILDIKENGDYVIERNGMLEYCITEDAIIGVLKSVSDTPEPSSHFQFKALTEFLFNTYKLKNFLYGDSYIAGVKRYGKTSALQILFQKFSRIENIIMKDINAEEGLGDSILDMANYLIMTYMALELEKPLKFENE